MKASRVQSIPVHIVATMFLLLGFVKAADKLDPLNLNRENTLMVMEVSLLIGTLPCGTSKED